MEYRPLQLVCQLTTKFFRRVQGSPWFENASRVVLKCCEKWNIFWSEGQNFLRLGFRWLAVELDFWVLDNPSFTASTYCKSTGEMWNERMMSRARVYYVYLFDSLLDCPPRLPSTFQTVSWGVCVNASREEVSRSQTCRVCRLHPSSSWFGMTTLPWATRSAWF